MADKFDQDQLNQKAPPISTPNALLAGELERKREAEGIALLCKEFEILPDEHMFYRLAVALAQKFVPSFQEKVSTGPKPKWTPDRLGVLAVEFETLLEEIGQKIGVARNLVSAKPFCDFIVSREKGDPLSDPAGALLKQYREACKLENIQYLRKSLISKRSACEPADWEAYLTELFAGE